MRRFALALAATVLGTGCISSTTTDLPPTPSGTATFFWQFRDFTGATAGDYSAAHSGCSAAGVTDVRVTVFSGSVVAFDLKLPCQDPTNGLPGAVTDPIAAGTWSYTLTAYRLQDPVFSVDGVVTIPANADIPVDTTLSVVTPAPLTMYYLFGGSATPTCSAQAGGYVYPITSVEYELYNSANVLVSSAAGSSALACSTASNGFTIPGLTAGAQYTLRYLEAWSTSYSNTTPVFGICNQPVYNDGFPVDLNVPAATAACP
jgi:hypothetical protein